jgi:hypothetical protein
MPIDVNQLSEAELVDLNHRIVERLRILQQLRAHDKMMEFSIGDRVMFAADGGPAVYGVLAKYNRKSVTVVAEDGKRWTVSPALLRHADVVDAVVKESRTIARKPT